MPEQNAVLLDPVTISQSFPIEPDMQVVRDNILDSIDSAFESGVDAYFVEGEEGVGKTTLLAQFATKHSERSISLFLRKANPWACDPWMVRLDVCNQISWLVRRTEIEDPATVDDRFMQLSLFNLTRYARQCRKPLFFVVDGLDQMTNAADRQAILQMLPLDRPPLFRFLFSGEPSVLPDFLQKRLAIKITSLPGFSLDETHRYLKDLQVTGFTPELHRICRGIPGRLASVRRSLKSGVDPAKFIEDMPTREPELFAMEWARVDREDKLQLLLLAVLAHDRRRHTYDTLARTTNADKETVANLLESLNFIEDDGRGYLTYISEPFRRFAEAQLTDLKETVGSLIIDELLDDPDSSAALSILPIYLEQTGRDVEVLAYLSPERLGKLLEHTQSIGPLKEKAALGLSLAEKYNKTGEIVRFGLQKVTLHQLTDIRVPRSELEAHIALGDYEGAIACASSAIVVEDRLALLATVGRALRRKGAALPKELVDRVCQLYPLVDYSALGDRAFEIAGDLVYCAPDLARDI